MRFSLPQSIYYYEYSTTVTNVTKINGEETRETVNVPDNSIVMYYSTYVDSDNYSYQYFVYTLIIDAIGTTMEEVVGVIDQQTTHEYHFQLNSKGGR